MNYRRRKSHTIREVIMNHQKTELPRIGFESNKYIPSRSRDFVHVLALELPRLSK